MGRPRGDKERCREVSDGAALVSSPNITSTCPLSLNRIVQSEKRHTRLTQYTGGGWWRGSARVRPLRVSLLRSVSVPGALCAVPGGGRTTGGRRDRSACPRVGHALYQRGATEDEAILREIVQWCRISGEGQSMGVARRPAGVREKGYMSVKVK